MRKMGQQEAFPRMALHQGALHNALGIAHMIRIRRVEIGESLLQKMVDHLVDLLKIDSFVASAQHGQAHESETKFFGGIR